MATPAHQRSSAIARLILIVAQVTTLVGFVVTVAGVALLQKTANGLHIVASTPAGSATIALYDTTFTQALVTPYPESPHFQFSLHWFIVILQLCIFVFTLILTGVPKLVPAGKSTALALLSTALTLTILVINSLVYLHKSPVANTVFIAKHINVALAGALIVAVANGFTIICLGLWAPEAFEVDRNQLVGHGVHGDAASAKLGPHNGVAGAV